jgi:hypothetical protein
MSTQLILYPQRYGGYSSNFTASTLEYIVDGVNFTSINGSDSYDLTGGTITGVLTLQPPTFINTWYRFRTATSGTPALPTQTANNLVLNSVTTYTLAGVYQRLSNLTVGAVYTFTVNTTALLSGGSFQLKVFNGATKVLYSQLTFDASIYTQGIDTFVAQSPEDIIMVTYYNTIDDNLTITDISITESIINPSGIYTNLQDGQVICDLYEEEDIPLTLSIDDFKNVAEKVQSYSKDFNLPATKRNNQIFNNMFEITRADDKLIFNPYVRTKCVLKQDGFILFEGFLRMIDVKDKEGEISYNVNLYSEVIALADILKDRTFSNLDFEELEHDYNKTQIKYSWNDSGTGITYLNSNTSGFRDANDTVKYPFIDWTHQYIVGGTNVPSTSATDGNPELTSLEQAFRPCIQLKYLINKIFADANFTYTSNFFDSADFEKLFMDFNWGANQTPTEPTEGIYWDDPLVIYISNTAWQNVHLQQEQFAFELGWDSANDRFVATQDNTQYNLNYVCVVSSPIASGDCHFRIAHRNSGGTLIQVYNPETDGGFTAAGNGTVSVSLATGDTLQLEAKADNFEEYRQFVGNGPGNPTSLISASIGGSLVTTETILETNRGELGQWDFLKGIMTMFNLVTMADETDKNNILIEPYGDVFINNTNGGAGNLTLKDRGIEHDWTDKVDVSQMELKPLTDLNKNTIFKFVEDEDDYAFDVFRRSQGGHLYGSRKWNADGFTILEGTKEIIAEPFAATVSMPLDGGLQAFIVPKIYSMNDDGETEGFDNSPRIFYNNGIKDTGASYYMPEQNGVSDENEDEFLQFSHFSDMPSVSGTRDFVFETSQIPLILGNPPVNNLFATYWQPYYNELYNADTRTMTLKVNLSPSDIASFVFIDTVMIKNRSFRVNKIEYKPNSLAKVEFILIG